MGTLTYSGHLTIVTCWCGLPHAVPTELINYQNAEFANGRNYSIYCPLGHTWIPGGERECDRLKKELASAQSREALLRSQNDQMAASLRDTEARRRAEKGAKTKIKKRINNGLCPCCGRNFVELGRHIRHMHPDFLDTDAKLLSKTDSTA